MPRGPRLQGKPDTPALTPGRPGMKPANPSQAECALAREAGATGRPSAGHAGAHSPCHPPLLLPRRVSERRRGQTRHTTILLSGEANARAAGGGPANALQASAPGGGKEATPSVSQRGRNRPPSGPGHRSLAPQGKATGKSPVLPEEGPRPQDPNLYKAKVRGQLPPLPPKTHPPRRRQRRV